MSNSDDTENQCERRIEAYGAAMGDVLVKGYYNEDTSRSGSSDDSQDDSRIVSEGQDNESPTNPVDNLSSSRIISAPADTRLTLSQDNRVDDIHSADTALRIDRCLISTEAKPRASEDASPKHSSECPSESPQHLDSFCPCDMRKLCKLKRVMIDDELKREIRWHRLWTELRDHIRSVFDAALEATVVSATVQYQCDPFRLSQLRENVIQMCKRNSQQLLLMLIVQAQEFVIELKNRIKETLDDRSLSNVAEIFLTRILDGYDAFVSTAKQVTDLVKPVEERHLLKFNLTWEFFNKALYENHIWMSEPSMRNVTGSFTTQLTKSRKRHSYQALFERYVAFVEEMMRVAELWPETERLIVKWNDKQTAERGRAADVAVDSNNVSSSSEKSEKPVEAKIVDDAEKENNGCENTAWRSNNQISPRLTNGLSVSASTETNLLDSSSSLSPAFGVGESVIRQDCHEARDGFLKKRSSTADPLNPLQELDVALRHKTDIVQEIASDLSESLDRQPQRQMCQCIYEHMREIDETGRTWWSDSPCLCVLNLRWLCGVSKACPCLATAPTKEAVTNERPESPSSTTTHSPVKPSETSKDPGGLTNSRFCQSAQKQTRHSTTQTINPEPATAIIPEEKAIAVTTVSSTTTTSPLPPPLPCLIPRATLATHNRNPAAPHQGSTHTHFHGTTPDLVKSTGPSRRAHTHNNHASHACHKQAKVEHIKRVLCNDLSPGDGDCSDSGSSQEDSSSTSSSTPRDSNRHCDCCYCEVFGPGVPSVAPVSRNYNEMRERLRQLLTKKKAKKCKTPCSPPKSPVELSEPPNTSADKKPACPPRPAVLRSNTPIPVVSTIPPEQQDERDLEALLEFIEGNQGTKKDNKKTEKKARQKQRKLEELLTKAKEEDERQKLVQLQKKTPEVTITVVDPQKPVFQRLLPQRNLPEVSILPATASRVPVLGALKQACNNSKKKDKQQQQQQQQQQEMTESLGAVGKTKTAMISVTPINLNVFDFVVRESVASKRISKSDGSKNDKATISKNGKAQPVATRDLGDSDLTDVKLTKKERKRLRRQMKSLEDEKAKEPENRVPPQPENQPQIVTIKRVMESNSAEPTVTITLKGQTPADDKVLFTLVNGQTKELGSVKSEQNQGQASSGKKKKGKKTSGNNNQNNGNQSQQQPVKGQQQHIAGTKSQTCQKPNDAKSGKQQQQQQQQQQQPTSNEKSKGKKLEEKKIQQQQQIITETKSTKSKKDQKSASSKQTVVQQVTNSAKSKNTQQQQQQQQQQHNLSKKQNIVNTTQQNQTSQKLQQSHNITNESSGKKTKGQQLQDKNNVGNSSNKKKNTESNSNKQSIKGENQKNRTKSSQPVVKQQQQQQANCYISNDTTTERNGSALSSQLKDVTMSSKINIENLKLPPGITITKVDAPAKPLPIKSAPIPKPVTVTKQTTIIAAPMSGVQSSYAGSQSGGNVIVVDTGKLKQDLLPKNSGEKDIPKESQQGENATSGKKKKKKNKKGKNLSSSGNASSVTNGSNRGGNDSGKENGDEPARILHNPGSNMVTIRNPAFGPPPKMDTTPQAAIIKVSENGMVTIRSPALQQAINAGLTPPPKPDFIVRGDPSKGTSATSTATGRTTLTPSNSLNHNNTNGIISSSFAELRSRLTPDCTGLSGLANIHISKVTNGQPIPENGINLKGTSVTLTKVRSAEVPAAMTPTSNTTNMEEVPQAKSAVREAISATIHVPGSGKSKKKKKRGTGTRHCGDDWNLVESVFTPKDIDLEDGEMDDAERELEAFKRFCQQSVPPPRKEKVNLNIKDIVLKKKCSSSSSAAGAAIAAN